MRPDDVVAVVQVPVTRRDLQTRDRIQVLADKLNETDDLTANEYGEWDDLHIELVDGFMAAIEDIQV